MPEIFSLKFSQLPVICRGKLLQLAEDRPLLHLLLDSRRPLIHAGTVFFAIKGERHDGHQFIAELYALGIRQFVVENKAGLDLKNIPEANVLLVDDAVQALQQMASAKRNLLKIPVIGITGSNGKTIVKEWLAQLLGEDFRLVKSPKSYNSQTGVPLSVWQLDESTELGIFEAGISQPGEMERLEKVVSPSIGIFTNIGSAHDQGFESKKQKIKEKLKLFTNCKKLIYCLDHKELDEELRNEDFIGRTVSWSCRDRKADYYIGKEYSKGCVSLDISRSGKSVISVALDFTDDASIENVLHCIITALELGLAADIIVKKVAELHSLAMRLELKQGINGCYLVDDSYNNDLAGLETALDFLSQQHQREHRSVILSDMLEAGGDTRQLYSKVSKLMHRHKIRRLIAVGPTISAFDFTVDEFFGFENTEKLLENIDNLGFANELVLIKGARSFGFERVVNALQEKIHGTRLEINLDALTNNLNYYRSLLQPSTKLMVMVKAFSYGSGSFEVANLLQYHRVDYLAVAYTDEGIHLRKNGVNLPIMVMSPSPDSFDLLVQHNLEPEIYSMMLLQRFADYTSTRNISAKIHLKLDTGMNRLGFKTDTLPDAIALLKQSQQLKVASIFSHLAGSDEEGLDEFTKEQAENYEQLSQMVLKQVDGQKPLRHLLNSAGIVRFSEYHYDMVRLGIGLYGIETGKKAQAQLMPVGTLKTTVSQIKTVLPGQTIGYGRKGKAEKKMKIATIAIGYADGFSRAFGNGKASVWINGEAAETIGNICMDMCMIDITGIRAEEGDEVTIFSSAEQLWALAESAGTIPYEILTNVGERVKRVFFAG